VAELSGGQERSDRGIACVVPVQRERDGDGEDVRCRG
jgi:hypothetical protein